MVRFRERPAIVHVASGHRGYEYALVALALKERFGIPVVYEVRGFLEETWTGDEQISATAAAAELTRRRMIAEARVMDAAAFSLCMDNRIPIIVFNFFKEGEIMRVLRGEKVGTLVTA